MNALQIKIPHNYRPRWVIERAHETLGLICKNIFRKNTVEGLFKKIIWNTSDVACIHIETILEDDKVCIVVARVFFEPKEIRINISEENRAPEARVSPLYRQLIQRWRSGDMFLKVIESMLGVINIPE